MHRQRYAVTVYDESSREIQEHQEKCFCMRGPGSVFCQFIRI
jgi:hypothetical protein